MLSIAIPLYNKFASIEATILSCIRACTDSGVEYEVVVSNNASKDVTPEELDYLASKYSKVRVIHLPQTISAPDNWLFALNCCQGKYLKLQLADDEMPAFDLQHFLEPLEAGLADYVVGKTKAVFKAENFSTVYYDLVNSFRALINPSLSAAEKADLLFNQGNVILSHNPFGDTNALIFHSKCLTVLNYDVINFRPSFTIMPDIDLYLSLFTHHRGAFIDRVVAYFCYYDNSPCVRRANEVGYDFEGLMMLETLQPLYLISSSKFKPITKHLSNEKKEQLLLRVSQITSETLGLPRIMGSYPKRHSRRINIRRLKDKLRTAKAQMLAYLKDKLLR